MAVKLEDMVMYLFEVFPGAEKETFNAYLLTLASEDVEKIGDNIKYLARNWKPAYGQKFPPISEIISPSRKQEDIEAKVELAWQRFKKNMCNNIRFEPIPDDVYTIKKLIGIKRCEHMTLDKETWLKKEFREIWLTMKETNHLMIQQDPNSEQLKLTEAGWCLPVGKDDKALVQQLGGILKEVDIGAGLET